MAKWSELKQMSDEELVNAHDNIGEQTGVWVDYYVDEMRHRQQTRIARRMELLTKWLFGLTAVMLVSAAVQVGVAISRHRFEIPKFSYVAYGGNLAVTHERGLIDLDLAAKAILIGCHVSEREFIFFGDAGKIDLRLGDYEYSVQEKKMSDLLMQEGCLRASSSTSVTFQHYGRFIRLAWPDGYNELPVKKPWLPF